MYAYCKYARRISEVAYTMMYTKLQSAEAAKPVHVYAVFSQAYIRDMGPISPNSIMILPHQSLMWERDWTNTFDVVAGSTQAGHCVPHLKFLKMLTLVFSW